MACVNMLNPDHQPLCGAGAGSGAGAAPPMSPRISFSNDFILDPAPPSSAPRHAASSSDPHFEFSVGSRPMMAADELFFKGRMLPLRGNSDVSRSTAPTTLRDELRSHDEDGRPPKGSSSIRWKELLGLKKPNAAALKKNDREM